jgi:hypothetical protein
MAKNNYINFSFWLKFVKKFIKLFQKRTLKYKNTLQRIQLTFIYFFAFVVLLYSIKTSLGAFPEIIFQIFPFIQQLLDIQILKILATPEKTFVLYLVVLEVLINRSLFNFSLLVKFNVLLIFILEMFQNLIASYWDLLFNREIEIVSSNSIFIKNLTIIFFCLLFIFFFILYLYSYIRSLRGLFPTFPGVLQRIVDSVCFWLQIKIPKKQKDKDKEKDPDLESEQ